MIKAQIGETKKVMAVVKDNAYGHGLVPISKALEPDVYGFCMARAEEGVALREAGITKPILIFEIPTSETSALYPLHNLTATVADISTFEIMAPGTEYHLNFDTGMRRLGLLPSQLGEVKTCIKKRDDCNPTGIYTHFFKSDDPGNEEVLRQIKEFTSLRKHFPDQWLTHTANSGAIFHYAKDGALFDAVRAGVSLYGLSSGNVEIQGLKPVMELWSVLDQVKPIKKGETVSYGATWKAPQDGFVGTIPVGYGAGIPRRLSNLIQLNVHGKSYPQVGTITMDYMMVFLGDDRPEIGATVQVLGNESMSATDWAGVLGTISYEIITQINWLVPRKYLN